MIPLIKPQVGEEELEAIREVFTTGYLTEGPVTKEFEEKFADYIGVKRAIAVTSASTALMLALQVLGIGSGDEIIVPDFTFPITASMAVHVGAEPVLVDIDTETYAIKPEEVEKAITEKTKVVVPVSLFGNPVNLDPLKELQERYGFTIIEDAAGATGAKLKGKMAGSDADLAAYSFHPRKIITTGEGGMLTTNNEEIADRAYSYKHFGAKIIDGDIRYIEHGTNFKLCNILAAIGLVQMKKIDSIIKERQSLAKVYDELLEGIDQIRIPQILEGAECTYQSYTCLIKKEGIRDNIITDMRKEGVETQIGTYSLSLHPAFSDVKKVGTLENSHIAYHNTLTLPMYHNMKAEEQELVCEKLKRSLEKY